MSIPQRFYRQMLWVKVCTRAPATAATTASTEATAATIVNFACVLCRKLASELQLQLQLQLQQSQRLQLQLHIQLQLQPRILQLAQATATHYSNSDDANVPIKPLMQSQRLHPAGVLTVNVLSPALLWRHRAQQLSITLGFYRDIKLEQNNVKSAAVL